MVWMIKWSSHPVKGCVHNVLFLNGVYSQKFLLSKFEQLINCRYWIFLGPQAGPDTSIEASTESTGCDRHCGRHCGLKINIAPKIPSLRRQFHDTVRINGRKVNDPEKFGWRYTEKLSRGNTWEEKVILMKQNPTWLFFLYLGWYWLWESPDKISKSGYYTFEWLKMVSEVRFLRFWGVFYIEKCFGNSVSVINGHWKRNLYNFL